MATKVKKGETNYLITDIHKYTNFSKNSKGQRVQKQAWFFQLGEYTGINLIRCNSIKTKHSFIYF